MNQLDSELIEKLHECFAEADKRPKNMFNKTKLTSYLMEREKQILDVANDYVFYELMGGKEPVDQSDIEKAFIDGAEWADTHPINVWHDASEEPKEDMDILFISKNGEVHKVSKIDNQLYDWLKDNDDIKKWAYIKDILPK